MILVVFVVLCLACVVSSIPSGIFHQQLIQIYIDMLGRYTSSYSIGVRGGSRFAIGEQQSHLEENFCVISFCPFSKKAHILWTFC